jgi:MFS family permease
MLVATMIPAMVEDIGGTRLIAWLFALYETGSIVAGISCGLLILRYGLRLPMTIAALLFAGGCVISAMAPSMSVVLMGRVFQGVGGGSLVAISFISLGLLFPRHLMPRAMAAMSILWGTSAFIGPLVGGLFVEYGSWRGAFWFFAVQAMLLAFWIFMKFSAEKFNARGAQSGRIPSMRLINLCMGVLLIAWAGIRISMPQTPVLIVAGLLCLANFVRLDSKRNQNRLLPRAPLSLNNPVGAGLTMLLCFTTATIAITVYGPFLITKLHHVSALTAGYIVACASIGWSIAAVLVSGMAETYDSRMIGIGMGILTLSVVGFVFSVAHGPLWLIAVFALVEGAGFGMSWTFILRRATALAAPSESERVAGAITPMQRLGYALGAAYVGIVANAAGVDTATDRAGFESVATWIFIACLPFALFGLIAARQFLGRPRPTVINK